MMTAADRLTRMAIVCFPIPFRLHSRDVVKPSSNDLSLKERAATRFSQASVAEGSKEKASRPPGVRQQPDKKLFEPIVAVRNSACRLRIQNRIARIARLIEDRNL